MWDVSCLAFLMAFLASIPFLARMEESLNEARVYKLSSDRIQQYNELLLQQMKLLEERLEKSDEEIHSYIALYQESVLQFQDTLNTLIEESKKRALDEHEPVSNMPWDFWSRLLLLVDGWLLEKKISAEDAQVLREMVWQRKGCICDAFLESRGKNERDVLSTFLRLTSSPKRAGLHIIHIAAEMAPVAKVVRLLLPFCLQEIHFDIDANGILSVTAVEKGTGKKQDITITGASTLPSDEVEKMVREAEKFAKEDKEKRDAIDTKNQAESVVYQTKKQLKELGHKVPAAVKEKVEAKLGELKEAILGSSTQTIKDAMAALNQEVMQLGQALYNQPGPGATPGEPDASGPSSSSKPLQFTTLPHALAFSVMFSKSPTLLVCG